MKIIHFSWDEDRFILLGLSCKLKILTVVHCYKDDENNIRIISVENQPNLKQNNTRSIYHERRI